MSDKFWDNDEFKKLHKKWKLKLEKSGFKDIEQDDKHNNLKNWSATDAKKHYKPGISEITASYYRLAGQFLHDHTFSSPKEKLIWDLHANGYSFRDITLILKSKRIRTNRATVGYIIRDLVKLMKKKYIFSEDGSHDDYCG